MDMSESPSPGLWSTVAALPDYLLLSQTRQLARHEQALQVLVLDHLREIEARGLHLTRGYGSLFDYVVHELGYTAAAAWRRIKAMRLCSATNGARELLQDGKLNLSNAAQLQNLFERSDRGHGRGRPPDGRGSGSGPGGAPRSDGAAGEPAPAAPMRAGGGDPAPGSEPVLDAAAREELVKQAVGKSTREVQQMVAEVDPESARPNDRMRALGNGRWELKATIDAECRHGLEKLQMLLSHTDPHLTLGGLVARLVRDGLHRYDPARPPRSRRSVARGSASGERSANDPARREQEAAQRNVARATGGAVERRSEIEPNDVSMAAVQRGAPRPSAPKRDTEAEHGSAKPAPVADIVGRTDSAPKRRPVAEHGGVSPAATPNSAKPPASPPKRQSEAEHGRTSRAVAQDGAGRAASAPKWDTEPERNGAKPAVVGDMVRRTASAPKRFSQAEHGAASSAATPNSGGPATSLAKCQSEAEHGRASSAVARDGGRRAGSAAKRRTEAERGGAQSSAMGGRGRRTDSAPKRPSEPEHGGASPAATPNSGRPATSPAKRQSDTEHGRASHAVPRDSGGRAGSAAKRATETERSGAQSSAVGGRGRRTDSAPKRVGRDAHIEEAVRLRDAAASAPGRRRETEHVCGRTKAMRGSGGRVASPAKRLRQPGGDDRDAGMGGVVDRATWPAGPQFEADPRNASRIPVRGGSRFPTSAAKRFAYAAGLGAAGAAEGSPALERHLAALSCIGTWPGSRSRYIPAAVKDYASHCTSCRVVDVTSGKRRRFESLRPRILTGGSSPGCS